MNENADRFMNLKAVVDKYGEDRNYWHDKYQKGLVKGGLMNDNNVLYLSEKSVKNFLAGDAPDAERLFPKEELDDLTFEAAKKLVEARGLKVVQYIDPDILYLTERRQEKGYTVFNVNKTLGRKTRKKAKEQSVLVRYARIKMSELTWVECEKGKTT
jgi:hypothetical protein